MWLRADRQTGGRGRQGRAWDSLTGNVHASTLVRIGPQDRPAPGIALVAALAARDAVARFVDPARLSLKWPNDLMGDGAKLGGILMEAEGKALVVGFGINVGSAPVLPDRPVTCLQMLGASPVPTAAEVTEGLSETFGHWLGRWRAEGFDTIRTCWLERAHPVGAPLRVHDAGGAVINGLFDGLANDGALRLRLADGTVHVMHAGDTALL